ncbi:CARDB domain-containing protein [Thermococcus nautili]|uniref:CARDB domain-containing protein n=1 Tax=Thermococcus nautili TaxID=195522 RepID=W8P5L9_9EURY|nr:CARDB domain-containing protein [Thermococcus nautili]AHL22770.1 hypothetical protein BD01_1153 [Thermococcus nautili]
MVRRQGAIVVALILLLLGSGVPAVMGVSYAYSRTENVQLFIWPSSRLVEPNQTVTIAVVLWKPGEGGIANATVTIETEDGLYNVTTNEDGFASLNLTFAEEGGYWVRAAYGNLSTGTWIDVEKVPPYLFIEKDLELQVNRSYSIEWTLVTPYVLTPYSGAVNVTVFFNGREVRSEVVNVTDGKLKLTLRFNETGAGEVLFDGRTASHFEVREKIILAKLIGPDKAYVGQNVTVHLLVWDAGANAPYSGNLTVELKRWYYSNWTTITDNITVGVRDGYANFTLTVPDCDRIEILAGVGSHDIRIEKSAPAPQPPTNETSNETPLIFTITPDRVLAEPGQSISLVVNTTREGTYNMTITWYPWEFRSWVWDWRGETNTTLVTFNGTKSVIKRITVPEWAYYGEVRIGDAMARIYTLRPNLWGSAWVNLTYSPETGLKTGDTLMISGGLENRTKDWFYDWEKFYRGLANETVYIFTPWGVKTVKTDEDGRFSANVSVPSERLPNTVWDRKPEVLFIHRSGAYEDTTVDTPRARVFVNMTSDGVRINIEPADDRGIDWGLKTPTVVEFGQYFDWKYIGNVTSLYVTSNATVPGNVSPGVYLFKILPNNWLCYRDPEGGVGCSAGSHTTERIYYVTSGLELPRDVEYTGGELEVPIKLPGKGVFYYSYEMNGQRYYGIGFTDENGNGIARIKVEDLPLGVWRWLIIKFGFVSDKGALFDIDWDLWVHSTVDTLPPAVTATVTPQVQEVGKNVTINISVWDNGGIKQVNYTITNVTDVIERNSLNFTYAINGYSVMFNFTIRGLEDYILNVTAVDEAGHVTTKLVNFFGKAVETRELNLTANETHEVNVENQTQIVVAPAQNESVTMNVTVASGVENEDARVKMTAKGYEDLKYVKVETNETVKYSWVILNLTYSDEMLKRLGISENAVTLLYWNGTEWIDLSKHVGETIPDNSPYGNITVFGFGRDPVHNYVWANVSHLSEYALGVKLPDLKVEAIGPTKFYVGVPQTINVTIKNLGGPVDRPFDVVLYVNGTEVGRVTVSEVSEGAEFSLPFKWTPEKEGNYTIKAVVDPDNRIQESNESNNELIVLAEATRGASLSASGLVLTLMRVNYLYYLYYTRNIETFEKLYQEAVKANVSNATLQEALKHKELAEGYYKEAAKYGPVLSNIGNIRLFPYLRKAYVELKKAIEILEKALKA